MHPHVLGELSDGRLEDYHRRAAHARRVAEARRARGTHRAGRLRARAGALLVALGTAIAGGPMSAVPVARPRGAR